MTIYAYNVLDGDITTVAAPRVPTVDDFGGASYINEAGYPVPSPPDVVPAEAINQMIRSLAGVLLTAPKASFTLTRATGAATLVGFSSINTALVTGDLTAEVADPMSAGENVLVVKWLKGQLPAAVNAPQATIVGKLRAGLVPSVGAFIGATYAGITVSVQTAAGAASTAFTVRVDCDGEGNFGA
jgi:hypothetical protein